MPRVNPSDEIDTVAYAVSLMKAAKRLAEGEEEWEDNHSLIVPFYMLIGFSLENALKAVLEFNGSDPGTKWSHSHDLQKLRVFAEGQDFVLSEDLREFVDHLSPLHKDHHFRYPQKAETAHLLKPIAATELTERLLVGAFLAIDGRNAWTTEGSESPCETVAESSPGGFRAGRTLPLNHRHNLEDKADPEIVAADPRLRAGKTHHSKSGSAVDRCLAGKR